MTPTRLSGIFRDPRFVLIIISLLALLWVQTPRLSDEFQVDRDFRTFYWMNKFQDPELFPAGKLTGMREYVEAEFFSLNLVFYFYSLGYSWLYHVASFFVPLPLFSNLLSFFLMPITVWYAFEFGRAVKDRQTGVALALGFIFINLASSSSLSLITGLQRSFTIPLILIFIYYLHQQNYRAVAIISVISALLYPPMLILMLATWGLTALKMTWQPSIKVGLVKRELVYLLLTVLLGGLILLPILSPRLTSLFTVNQDVGNRTTTALTPAVENIPLWQQPRFMAGGHRPLFYFFPFVGRGGIVEDSEEVINFLVLFIISGLILLVLGRRTFKLPPVIWYLMGAGFVMFGLAWLGIWLTKSFILYVPNRYTRVSLFLFLLVYITYNGREALQIAPTVMRDQPKKLIWLIVAVEFGVLGLLFFYPDQYSMISGFNMKWLLGPAGFLLGGLSIYIIINRLNNRASSKTTQKPLSYVFVAAVLSIFLIGWAAYSRVINQVGVVDPPPAERELLAFIETLPIDSVLAGTPCLLDNVPLFAKRAILFSCFYSDDSSPIQAGLAAYYAAQSQQVIEFCRNNAVDYLVVDTQAYSPEFLAQRQVFFEPYNQKLLSQISNQNDFVLAQIPDEKKLFQHPPFFVMACQAIE